MLFYFHYSVFLYFYKEKNEITLTLYLVADVALLSKAFIPQTASVELLCGCRGLRLSCLGSSHRGEYIQLTECGAKR